MDQARNNKLRLLKTVFLLLLFLDVIALILSAAALLPTFKRLAGDGMLMLAVTGGIALVAVAILIFEIWAKVFLMRSTAPDFSWSGRKGYVAVARLLVLFNLGAVLVGWLSAGGEGATLLNQANLYLRMLASVAEIVAAFVYLRTVKGILKV